MPKDTKFVHLYIDTNIFLSLYHFTADELEDLKKLSTLLQKRAAVLYVPTQTAIEFRRNRDNKIADAIKHLRSQKVALQVPRFAQVFPEYSEIQRLASDLNKALKKLVEKSDAEIASGKLAADEVVRQLFARANSVPTSEDILAAARLRRDLGNPPGTNGSLGDAINWESLLQAVPPDQDLHLISADRDYASPLDTSVVHAHLSEEWKKHKNAAVHLYPRLSTFFRAHFPDSNLASDLEKDLLIKDLAESSSFRATHSTVAKLAGYTDFTPQQRQRIVDAALNNSQVSLISADEDVAAFLHKAVLGAPEGPDDWSRSMLQERLSSIEPLEEEAGRSGANAPDI